MTGPLAIFANDLNSGGVQRTLMLIASGLAESGRRVDLLLAEPGSVWRPEALPGLRILPLARESRVIGRLRAVQADPRGLRHNLLPLILPALGFGSLPALHGLVDYLRCESPQALLAPALDHAITASLAKRWSGSRVRLVASFRSHPTTLLASKSGLRNRHAPDAFRRALGVIDRLHAVSVSVRDDAAQLLGLPIERFSVFHSPTLRGDVAVRAAEPVDHPWLSDKDRPVVLTVGRIAPQKDIPTLLRAFAKARASRAMRLIVIGEARQPRHAREAERLNSELGITDDVDFVGFQANPLAWMARSDVFALTSRFEGLPNAIIEALACGCRIVATDAPGGTAEILDGGRFGRLVPVGDADAVAQALLGVLDSDHDPCLQKRRAADYAPETSIRRYLELLEGET